MNPTTYQIRHLKSVMRTYAAILLAHAFVFFWRNSMAEDITIAIDIVIWAFVVAEARGQLMTERKTLIRFDDQNQGGRDVVKR